MLIVFTTLITFSYFLPNKSNTSADMSRTLPDNEKSIVVLPSLHHFQSSSVNNLAERWEDKQGLRTGLLVQELTLTCAGQHQEMRATCCRSHWTHLVLNGTTVTIR